MEGNNSVTKNTAGGYSSYTPETVPVQSKHRGRPVSVQYANSTDLYGHRKTNTADNSDFSLPRQKPLQGRNRPIAASMLNLPITTEPQSNTEWFMDDHMKQIEAKKHKLSQSAIKQEQTNAPKERNKSSMFNLFRNSFRGKRKHPTHSRTAPFMPAIWENSEPQSSAKKVDKLLNTLGDSSTRKTHRHWYSNPFGKTRQPREKPCPSIGNALPPNDTPTCKPVENNACASQKSHQDSPHTYPHSLSESTIQHKENDSAASVTDWDNGFDESPELYLPQIMDNNWVDEVLQEAVSNKRCQDSDSEELDMADL